MISHLSSRFRSTRPGPPLWRCKLGWLSDVVGSLHSAPAFKRIDCASMPCSLFPPFRLIRLGVRRGSQTSTLLFSSFSLQTLSINKLSALSHPSPTLHNFARRKLISSFRIIYRPSSLKSFNMSNLRARKYMRLRGNGAL
ncbi:hypothetical protein DL98DRAFT_127463 [Cadophora sp. DSE1049]|nr:hypothetical protein DL98DRAFT_127463 [Cadophora sp. DSE1049]